MAWRLLAVLLVLTGTAWSAPIVIKCYDGSSSAIVRWPNRSGTRLGVCVLDHALDGRCQFHVSLGATGKTVPGVFDVVLHVGRRKRVQYVDTTAVLKCRPGPEPPPPPPPPVSPPPGAVTYICQDAILVDSSTDPVCDVDQACDHTCTFGFHCPHLDAYCHGLAKDTAGLSHRLVPGRRNAAFPNQGDPELGDAKPLNLFGIGRMSVSAFHYRLGSFLPFGGRERITTHYAVRDRAP